MGSPTRRYLYEHLMAKEPVNFQFYERNSNIILESIFCPNLSEQAS